MDVVFDVGDISFIEKAKRTIYERIEKASILCLVSHDLNFCKAVCNRAIVVADQKITFSGEVDSAVEFYTNSQNH